ncbi:MAG: GspH/FimT family protein [Gudongella sp.]|nr:GspH/FimT family protein [Gudongella sp.]
MEILTNYKEKKKGYTLIELIVVLALFSLLLTIAIPNSKAFKTYNQNQQLRIFEKDIRQARNKAIIENKAIGAYFYITKNSYEIKYIGGEKILERELYGGVEFKSKNFTNYIFNPNGAIGNAGTVIIKKGSENYELAIAPVTSKISLRKDN